MDGPAAQQLWDSHREKMGEDRRVVFYMELIEGIMMVDAQLGRLKVSERN